MDADPNFRNLPSALTYSVIGDVRPTSVNHARRLQKAASDELAAADPFVARLLAHLGPGATARVSRPDEERPKQEAPIPSRRPAPIRGYGIVCEDVVRRGWQVVPQTREEKRMPGRIGGETIRWADLARVPWSPKDARTVARWRDNWGLNAALVLGEASGGTWALDSDVDDPAHGATVRALADEIFGPTPFVRTRPDSSRFAALYRYDSLEEVQRGKIHTLAGDVEILGLSDSGTGAMLTSHGLHWKKGTPFLWSTDPAKLGPEGAPVVSRWKIRQFERRVEEALGAVARPTVERRVEAATYGGEMLVPGGSRTVAGVVYDPTSGKVIDGRDEWLTKRTYSWYVHNIGAPIEALVDAVVADAQANVLLTGRWLNLAKEAESKFRYLASKDAAGKLKKARLVATADGRVYSSQAVVPLASDDGDVLAFAGPKRRAVKLLASTSPDAALAARRAFLDPAARAETTTRVSREVRDAIQTYLDALWDVRDAESAAYKPAEAEARRDAGVALEDARARLEAVRLLVSPTGSGKTSTFMRLVAIQVAERGRLGGPVVFMLPSYNNIAESEKRLEAAKVEESAKREADIAGVVHAMFEGKVKGGCLLGEGMQSLMDAGVGTRGICVSEVLLPLPPRGEVRVGPKTERVECVHGVSGACPIPRKRREAPLVDVLFMPTAFLSLPMEAKLRDAIRGVVVDERCWPGLIQTREFPMSALTAPRARGYATQAERDKFPNVSADKREEAALNGMHGDRDEAAQVAMRALNEGKCPAAVLRSFTSKWGASGREMAENAARVCGRAGDTRKLVRPNMTPAEIAEVAKRPKAAWLWEEKAFWTVILDRMTALDDGTATGDHDYRIQLWDRDDPVVPEWNKGGPTLRVSWRVKSKLVDHPTMLLDASAHSAIVGKLWNGRRVDTTTVDAPLHIKMVWCPDMTWADSSYVPAKAHPERLGFACANMVKLRRIGSAASGIFGHGRVLMGLTKTGRYAYHRNHGEAANLDTLHYGALAGLDFAKNHLCAIAVGRMEVPTRAVDGIVAALTYDDAIPEEPVDRGDGLNVFGKPTMAPRVPRTIQRRDGSSVTVEVPEHTGYWARVVQRQNREENLRQFIGRLRPVYPRAGNPPPPLVIVLGSVLPEDIVVDEIVHSDDLARHGNAWDAVRRSGVAVEKLAAAMAPDLDALPDLIEALKPTRGPDGMSSRVARGLVEVELKVPVLGGETLRRSLVIPGYTDVSAAARAWQLRWRHEVASSVRVVARGAEPVAAEARPRDAAFERELGDRDDRYAAEDRERSETVVALSMVLPAGASYDRIRLGDQVGNCDYATEYRLAGGSLEPQAPATRGLQDRRVGRLLGGDEKPTQAHARAAVAVEAGQRDRVGHVAANERVRPALGITGAGLAPGSSSGR